MKNNQPDKEHLIQRRDEINAQLNRVNEAEEIELDNDLEEQAIQTEQHEVSVKMEENLRKQLLEIENRLAEMDSENE